MIRRNLFAEILLLVLLGCCVDRGITRQLASSSGNSRPVELIWGIEEVQTPVGKLFNFTIPKDAFAGEIVDIKVTEAGKASLPDWLTFDPKSRQFVGLPVLTRDVRAHYIAVTVVGQGGASVEDVFTVIVRETDAKPECSSEAAQTVLTLILDVDWTSLSMADKTGLLGKFSSYMDIQVSGFKVSPVTGTGTSALFDSSALMAGPGNAKEVKFPGIKLSSVVGCDGNVNGNHNRELTTFVEEAAKDGSMAKFTGVDVLGWTLTTAKPVPSQRFRRNNGLFNTPEPSPVLPTVALQPGRTVQSTPFLTAPPGGLATDLVVGTAVLGVGPTPTFDRDIVKPTASAGQTTPELHREHYGLTTPPPPLPPPAPGMTKKPETGRSDRVGPKAGNPIGAGQPVIAVGGEVFTYQISKDAFVSPDAVPTVTLLEKDEKQNWLQVVEKDGTYTLNGLPMEEAKGVREYHLDVSDGVKTIQIPFKIDVQVKDESKLEYNHEVEIVLSEAYDKFNLERRLEFVDVLRSFYGDSDARHVVVRSIKSGSTVFTWTNDTYVGNQCADSDFVDVSGKIIQEDGNVHQKFQEFASARQFKIDKAMVRKIGPCAESAKQGPGGDIYLSMVVPIVVVSSLLLIACCIGCLLYKKRRGSKNLTPEPDQIFVGKNKPVIFKGEINENGAKGNNGASKKPALLADERPAVPPPMYPGRSPIADVRGQAAAHLAQHDDIDRDPREEQQLPLLYLPPAGDSDGDPRHPGPRIQLLGPSSRK